jgi:hypothetical protein
VLEQVVMALGRLLLSIDYGAQAVNFFAEADGIKHLIR